MNTQCRYRPQLDHLETRTTPAVFVLDPAQSCLSLEADLFESIRIEPQAEGSLRTCYDGLIAAEANLKALTLDVGFDSLAIAQVNGVWRPGAPGTTDCTESAEGNYGGMTNFAGEIMASFRDLYLATYGTVNMQDAGDGSYTVDSALPLDVAYGFVDVCHVTIGGGRVDLTGTMGEVGMTDPGSLRTLESGQMELTLRYNMTYRVSVDGVPVRVFVTGALVGVTEPGGSPAPGRGAGRELISILVQANESSDATPTVVDHATPTVEQPVASDFAVLPTTITTTERTGRTVTPLHVLETAILDLTAEWSTW